MPDNARYAARHAYTTTEINVCSCNHPHDLHYRHGCASEDCTCSFVPRPMNLVEAVRILNTDRGGDRQGWLR